jgi:hypothetical protein
LNQVLRQGLRREGSTGVSSPKINIDKAKTDDAATGKMDSPKLESPKPAGDSNAQSPPAGIKRLPLPSDSSPPGGKRNPLADSGSIDKDVDSPGRDDPAGAIRRRKASTNLSSGLSPRDGPKIEEPDSKKDASLAPATEQRESTSASPVLTRSPGPDKPRLKRIESYELRRAIDDREGNKPEEEEKEKDKDKKGKDKDKKKDKRLSRSNSSRPKEGSPARARKDSLSQSIEDSMEDSTEDTVCRAHRFRFLFPGLILLLFSYQTLPTPAPQLPPRHPC